MIEIHHSKNKLKITIVNDKIKNRSPFLPALEDSHRRARFQWPWPDPLDIRHDNCVDSSLKNATAILARGACAGRKTTKLAHFPAPSAL